MKYFGISGFLLFGAGAFGGAVLTWIGSILRIGIKHYLATKRDANKASHQQHLDAISSDAGAAATLLANIRSIRKPNEIRALIDMWQSIEDLDAKFEDILAYEDSVTPEQFSRIIQTHGQDSVEDKAVFEAWKSFGDEFAGKSPRTISWQHHPFVDPVLWACYTQIRHVYLRFGYLVLKSAEGEFPRWQNDSIFQGVCASSVEQEWLTEDEVSVIKSMPLGGVGKLLVFLRVYFSEAIQEALSGNGFLDRMDGRTAAIEPKQIRNYQSNLHEKADRMRQSRYWTHNQEPTDTKSP